MKEKNAQIAYEFLFVMFFLTFTFTVWLIFTSSIQEQLSSDEEYQEVFDVALQLQDDLYATIEMPDGFSRTINLPMSIIGKSYVINCTNSSDGLSSAISIQTNNYFKDVQGPPMDCTEKGRNLAQGENKLKVENRQVIVQ